MRKGFLYSSIFLLLFILPLLFLLYKSFVPFQSNIPGNTSVSVLGFLAGNTLIVSGICVFFAFIIGLGSALIISFFEFPGRNFFEAALCLPLAFPPYIVAAIYKVIAHHYYQTGITIENVWGAGLVFAFTLYPYFYLLLKTSFLTQSAAFMERGKSMGLHPGKQLLKIILPMAQPMIFLGLLLIVMEIMSDYGTVQILGIKTLTVGIYDTWFSIMNPRLAARLSLIVYALPLLILIIFTKFFRHASFYNPPNRFSAVARHPLSPRSIIFSIFILCIPLCIGFLFPLGILISWFIEKLQVTRSATLFMDLFNTLSLSLIVTGISIVISISLASLKRKNNSHGYIASVGWIASAQYAVPGIVFGIALLFLTRVIYNLPYTRWLVNSIFLIVFACVIRYQCFTYFSVESGMKRISSRLDERAGTLGKSKNFLLFHIHLPLLKPSIIIGCILVFISTIKELTMSLVLQPFQYSSLSLRIFSYASMDMFKNSAIYAICLVLICIYPVFSLNRWLTSSG